jgi:hypothetical protein
MKTSMLKMACILLLPLLPIVQSTPSAATPPVLCPTPTVIFSWDDYGWIDNGCQHDGLKERFVTVTGFTNCIELEMKVEDVSDYGTSSSTSWNMYCSSSRTYVGQDQEQWNDSNCNGQIDFGEYSTHTYSWTGNYRCP